MKLMVVERDNSVHVEIEELTVCREFSRTTEAISSESGLACMKNTSS